MARRNRTKAPTPSLVHEYKAATQLEAEAVSLNWVATLATVLVLTAGAVVIEKSLFNMMLSQKAS